MSMHPAVFFIFCGAAVAFSLFVILKKNPVASAFSLVMVFFCFAGIYASLSAHLIAALQILVYAGAIMVLFIFVIMLLNADEPSFDSSKSHPLFKIFAGIMGGILLIFVSFIFYKTPMTALSTEGLTPEKVESMGGNSKVLSELMFSKYILPFELTSVLLLLGIVGAITIAKRKAD